MRGKSIFYVKDRLFVHVLANLEEIKQDYATAKTVASSVNCILLFK